MGVFFARALCLKLRASSSSSASSPRVLLRFFTRHRKTGGGGWTHAHSPVSWLLCIQQQQQLCVNACAHGVHRCLTDAQLAGLQSHSPRNEGVRKGISQLFFYPNPPPFSFFFFLTYLLSPPRSHTVPPSPPLDTVSPPLAARVGFVLNGRNKLRTVSPQLRGSLRHTMDVRFYPSAGGNSIPGDPPNLDFAHCLGYYNFNKVNIMLCTNSVLCCAVHAGAQ